MRGGKGEQKSSETLGLLPLFSCIYRLGYSTFQEIFLENVATFFIFCKTSFGPRTSGGAPGASGASPTGADRF